MRRYGTYLQPGSIPLLLYYSTARPRFSAIFEIMRFWLLSQNFSFSAILYYSFHNNAGFSPLLVKKIVRFSVNAVFFLVPSCALIEAWLYLPTWNSIVKKYFRGIGPDLYKNNMFPSFFVNLSLCSSHFQPKDCNYRWQFIWRVVFILLRAYYSTTWKIPVQQYSRLCRSMGIWFDTIKL